MSRWVRTLASSSLLSSLVLAPDAAAQSTDAATAPSTTAQSPDAAAQAPDAAASPSAAAQSPDAGRERARVLGYAGLRAYAAGDFASASAQLEQSYALLPVPSLGLWSARAFVKLGQWVEAEARYRAVVALEVAADAPPVQHSARATAELELGELKPKLPSLTLRISGANAAEVVVSLDERPLSIREFGGEPPARLLTNPGQHRIVGRRGNERSELVIVSSAGRSEEVVLHFAGSRLASAVAGSEQPAEPGSHSASGAETRGPWRTAAWVSLAAGTASLGASALTYFLGRNEHDALEADGVCRGSLCSNDGDLGRYDTLRTTHAVTLLAGIALGAAGVTLLLVDPGAPTSIDPAASEKTPRAAASTLSFGLGPASALLTGTF